jgi:hypothetical protein
MSIDSWLSLKPRERDAISMAAGSVPQVERAKGLAAVLELVRTPEQQVSSIEGVDSAIEKAEARLGQLFEIEADARGFVSREIEKLKAQRREIVARTKFDGKFRTIPLSVLGWRDERGLPTLIPFDLASPRFVIETYLTYSGDEPQDTVSFFFGTPDMREMAHFTVRITPELPPAMAGHYKDVLQHFRDKLYVGTRSRASALFSGVIPEDIRATINGVRELFDRIFIIAEAKMDYTEVKIPVGDPIVAGWCDDTQSLYYVADFDTTAVEEAALLEGPARIG